MINMFIHSLSSLGNQNSIFVFFSNVLDWIGTFWHGLEGFFPLHKLDDKVVFDCTDHTSLNGHLPLSPRWPLSRHMETFREAPLTSLLLCTRNNKVIFHVISLFYYLATSLHSLCHLFQFLSGSIIHTIKKIPVFFICTYWFIQVYEQMQYAIDIIFGAFDWTTRKYRYEIAFF